MTHRFPAKEIALQSGLSTATVDRVLNARAGVSPQAKRRVETALRELEAQEQQLSARGRRLVIDVVAEAPSRFLREIRSSTERALSTFRPLSIRARFTFHETLSVPDCVAELVRIAKRGSDGVCLKARDVPEIRNAISDLTMRGIPVVTIFTDCPSSQRTAYAGLDNYKAGQTAGYLMSGLLNGADGTVLATQSDRGFQGEEDRLDGFRQQFSRSRPDVPILEVGSGAGLNRRTAEAIEKAYEKGTRIIGVYSMGGGNHGVIKTLTQFRQKPIAIIGHDLDEDNVDLLRSEALTLVLYHDLEQDMRTAIQHILAHRRVLPNAPPDNSLSDIQIITPLTIPDRYCP
ncbi:LacI family DNA-binding transcriptional regulator [Roseibium sp. TrichSKD4]|uniref:LacI family DNA-binding transcriptional regulator n=1 Tax=Roseibium sp. TrichSKD4 TaxID=744980 RepID=UPI0003054E25|nr:LacI family DNA-binding transcriptional regulator [Roseibium sp. TrichSKD4]